MGERATGVKNETNEPADETAAEPEASDLEQQIEDLRAELGALVQELDHRRHDAFDVRLQLRRHAGAVAIVASSLALIVGGRIWLVRRRRAHERLWRGINLAKVLSVLSKEDPSDVQQALRVSEGPSLIAAIAKIASALIPVARPPRRATGG